MNLYSLLKKDDYLMIKWQITCAVVGLMLSAIIFFGLDYLNSQSLQDLRIAQSEFNNARSRVELIEEEEATIIEYIGRYQVLNNEGVVQDEDRLQMFERVAQLRAENNLFPVSLNISEQNSMMLSYPPDIREPGGPIALRSSRIGLDLPLLHEEDLTRLLTGILDSPGLFQTSDCEVNLQSANTRNFIILSQHFTASCEILWYTFDLDPPAPDPFGF
jgi:hypothetical protein